MLHSRIEFGKFQYLVSVYFFVEDYCKNGHLSVNSGVSEEKETIVDWDCDKKVYYSEDCLDEGNDHAAMYYELT